MTTNVHTYAYNIWKERKFILFYYDFSFHFPVFGSYPTCFSLQHPASICHPPISFYFSTIQINILCPFRNGFTWSILSLRVVCNPTYVWIAIILLPYYDGKKPFILACIVHTDRYERSKKKKKTIKEPTQFHQRMKGKEEPESWKVRKKFMCADNK